VARPCRGHALWPRQLFGYNNERVNELIQAGEETPDPARARRCIRGPEILYEEAPAVFLILPEEIEAARPRPELGAGLRQPDQPARRVHRSQAGVLVVVRDACLTGPSRITTVEISRQGE
jgi:hypothetical protein